MSKKYIVYRKDINSNQIYPKDNLFRLVVINSKLVFDKDNSLKGRGIYLLKEKTSIENTFNKNRFLKRYNKDTLDILKEELLMELM